MTLLSHILKSSAIRQFSSPYFSPRKHLSYSVWRSLRCEQSSPLAGCVARVQLLWGPGSNRCSVNLRHFGGSASTASREPSSKIEETVERLKEKQKAGVGEKPVTEVVQQTTTPVVAESTNKKSLWIRVKDECMHYYSGFKLLFLDVKLSGRIVWKILQGKTLTRRESRQLVRTTSDLFRLVPFSVFILVPFMELLLPVALKLFPGMLPSTFTTSSQRDAKLKKAVAARLEYTRFLQKTLDEMGPAGSAGRSSRTASDFVQFYRDVRDNPDAASVDNDNILRFAKLFEDDITLDNMDRGQLSAICRLLNLTPLGTSAFLRLQIEMRLRHLKADDRLIRKEGMDGMSNVELQNANQERGMPAFGLSEGRLKEQLNEWIDLSLNHKVTPSLMLLSRTLYNVDGLAPSQKIAGAISALPEAAASATSASIGEREGKIRNVDRLEQIKEEQRRIDLEALEAVEEAEKKKAEPLAKIVVESKTSPVAKATVTEVGDVDTAPVLVDKAEELEPEPAEVIEEGVAKKLPDDQVSPAALTDLKKAIDSLGKARTESETLGELKRELEDYDEDIKELDEVKRDAKRHDLRESAAAKRLFGRVEAMLKKADSLVDSLKNKERQLASLGSDKEKDDGIVTVQELIEAANKLQETPDQEKLAQVAQVLSIMDLDHDGVIKVDHVLKVIELLGVESQELPAKQIKQIITVLCKEELLEVEDSIDDMLVNKPTEAEVDAAIQKDIQALEAGSREFDVFASYRPKSRERKAKRNGEEK